MLGARWAVGQHWGKFVSAAGPTLAGTFFIGCWLLVVAGCWQLPAGCSQLFDGCQLLLAAGRWLWVTGCRLLAASCCCLLDATVR